MTIFEILSVVGALAGGIALAMQWITSREARFNIEVVTETPFYITRNDIPEGFDGETALIQKWMRIINRSSKPITIISMSMGGLDSDCRSLQREGSIGLPLLIEPYNVVEGYFCLSTYLA